MNPALGMRVMVPHQCAKVRSVEYADELDYGLLSVRTNTRRLKMPGAPPCCMHRTFSCECLANGTCMIELQGVWCRLDMSSGDTESPRIRIAACLTAARALLLRPCRLEAARSL